MAASPPLRDDSNGATTDDRTQQSPDLYHPAADYRAEIVHYDDVPDECTIYPVDAQEWELMTRWITAREGSYVDLEAMR